MVTDGLKRIIIICVYYDMTVAHQYNTLKNEKNTISYNTVKQSLHNLIHNPITQSKVFISGYVYQF